MGKKKDLGPAPTVRHPNVGGVHVRHEDGSLELESDFLKRQDPEAAEEDEAEEADESVQAETAPRRKRRGRR